MFISYLDLCNKLNGFLLIISYLLFIYYCSVRYFETNYFESFRFNLKLFYYLLFVICFYIFYFLSISFVLENYEVLQYDRLYKFDIVKALLVFPVLEEIFFRKYLLVSLQKINSNFSSILFLSFGFTMTHCFTNSSLLYVFLMSVFFSWIYLKTRNIYLTIFLHSFNNFLSITTLINFLTQIKLELLFVVIFVLIVLIFVSIVNIKKDKINEFYERK
ncbi:CPBP family intramembrane glutamic endopeptidase [Flavobacterium phragmitis]